MTNCPRCGAPVQPHYRFCGTCAAPLQAAAPTPGPTLPVQHAPVMALVAQAPAACMFGHELMPGQGVCAQGHPPAAGVLASTSVPPPPPEPAASPVPARAAPAPAPTGAMSAYAVPVPPMTPPPPVASRPAAPPVPPAAPPMAAPAPVAPPAMAPAPPAAAPVAAPRVPSSPRAAASPRRALWGFVVSWHNDPLGVFWPLFAGPNYVGRAGAADGLHIEIADPATSSTHGTLHCDPTTGRLLIEDTGSTNGTFVNDERLPYQGSREIRDGDRVRFGSYTVRILLVPRG